MIRRVVITIVLIVGGLGSTARADDEITSWIRLDYFSSTRTLDDRHGAGSIEAGFKYAYDAGPENKLRFESNVLEDFRDSYAKVRLVEANWQHRGKSTDWSIGQQKVSWGKADGVNPTDFFTPHDYTVLQPFEADQRRSILALRADMAMNERQTVSLVVQPDFVATRMPLPPNSQITERSPDAGLPQLGMRWLSTGDAFDWSVCAFHGLLNTPLFSSAVIAGGGTILIQHYAKLDAFGADVARNFGQWGFRAEAAWLDPKAEDDLQGIRRHAYLVAGVDHGQDDWSIILQLIARYTPGVDNSVMTNPLAIAAARQNAVNFGQLHREQFGFTSRLAANWLHQTLQAELLTVYYFRPNNMLLRPLVSYALNDTNRITIGGEYYSGPDVSYFGQLKLNRTSFMEFQHFFDH